MDREGNTAIPCPGEVRRQAVQMVIDHLDSHASLTEPVRGIARVLDWQPAGAHLHHRRVCA